MTNTTDQSNRTGPARITAEFRAERLIEEYGTGPSKWAIVTEIKLAEMLAYQRGREDEKTMQEQSRRPEPRYGTP